MNLEDYLKEFSGNADKWFEKCDFIERNYNFITNFFKKDNLEKVEWSDVQSLGSYLHPFINFALARQKALGNPNHPIQHYRDSLIYLAYGSDPISERLNNLIKDDKYRIRNFGESILGELSGYIFSNDYVLYNRRDKHALQLLNIDPGFERGDGFGEQFVKFNNSIQPVIEAYKNIVGPRTDFPINLEVDQFFSYLFEEHSEVEQPQKEVLNETNNQTYWMIAPGKNSY